MTYILYIMTPFLWTLLILGVVAIIVALWFIISYNIKHKKPILELTYLESIKSALGSETNITSINLEQQRIQVIVEDTKKINASFFTNEKIPAFISGNKITVLFKEHAKEIYAFLASKGA